MSGIRRGITLLEVIIVVVVLLVLTSLFLPVRTNKSPGTGEKIGQVVKLSKQGMRWKTWEGQLIRGGMNAGSGSFGTVPFDFTVEDEAMAKKVDEYMRHQTEVILKYRMEGVYLTTRSESQGHFLVSIEPVKKDSV